MSPERAGSPQDQPKMSVPASPVAGTPAAEAESPIALLLAVAQCQTNKTGGDDDLTSLSWLHEGDVLKGINIVNPSPSSSTHTTPIKASNSNNSRSGQSSPCDFVIDESPLSATESSNSSNNSSSPPFNNNNNVTNVSVSSRMKHPNNMPYDPMVHTGNKPPYSFSSLIFMAIEDSKQKALPVKEIYAWILEHFPYYRNAPNGWKNSVRHNLSLNKSFQKVEKTPYLGKGSLWTVHTPSRHSLVQQLNRSPFPPCSTIDPTIYSNIKSLCGSGITGSGNGTGDGLQTKSGISRLPEPESIPYLSKNSCESQHINGMKTEPVSEDDSLDAVDAATVMLSLKNGPRYRHHRKLKSTTSTCQVITNSPSEDHTYSAIENMASSDAAYESEEERNTKSGICRKIDFEDEEERRIQEGAETLLNLAGITTRKRYNSQSIDTVLSKRKRSVNENSYFVAPCTTTTYEKPTQFRPRLLRTKRKDKPVRSSESYNNNNNIISSNNNNSSSSNSGEKRSSNSNLVVEDDWVRHRRELEERSKRR